MRLRTIWRWIACAGCLYITNTMALENIFYVQRDHSDDRMCSAAETYTSLKQHYKQINILIPQAYVINAKGDVKKSVEPNILQFVTEHPSIKLMPMVTNTLFDTALAHQFLTNNAAQDKAIDQLITACRQHHFYGVQFDFEMIALKDRAALTRFFEKAAVRLHQAGYKVSFAIAPVVTDKPESLFLQRLYENWEGAYDMAAIGKAADFVSIMAYNQHASGTTPGPTAALSWVAAVVQYALQYIPANKISLGLASYSTHWYTGERHAAHKSKIVVRMRAISYAEAKRYGNVNHATFQWEPIAGVNYAIFSKHWLNEYIFMEDKASFAKRYQLAENRRLRGVSVFDLGTEDPAVWEVMGS